MSSHAGVMQAYDDFTDTTVGAALGGRAAPGGGTWATSGVAPDFTAADGPASGDETMSRTNTAIEDIPGRVAILGSTSYADTQVEIDVYRDRFGEVHQAVIVRYIDASNYLYFDQPATSDSEMTLALVQVVAGTSTTLASRTVATPGAVWRKLRLTCYATGRAIAELFDSGGAVLARFEAMSTDLATGGALASGKPGFFDAARLSGESVSRYYDNFYVAAPAPEPIALHAGRTIEFRHDTVLREDATGTYAGPPPEYVGSRFFIPPAGDKGRKTRVAVVARRHDVTTSTDDHIADSLTVTVFATPRYLAVPRD